MSVRTLHELENEEDSLNFNLFRSFDSFQLVRFISPPFPLLLSVGKSELDFELKPWKSPKEKDRERERDETGIAKRDRGTKIAIPFAL